MPVQFTNLTAKVQQVVQFGLNFVPYEVVIGNTVGGLTQVSGVGTAGEVLTSQGPGQPPDWQPGGGGGGGTTRMPWDVLGGFVGSTYDVGLITQGNAVDSTIQPPQGVIQAYAVVCGEAVAFGTVAMLGTSAQSGSGSSVVVTDAAGNWLAHATNTDTALQGIGSTLEWVYFTLNTPVTPTAGQVVYVQTLIPAAVTVVPGLWVGPQGANWAPNLPGNTPFDQSSVAFPSAAETLVAGHTSIPNPSPVSGLTNAQDYVIWCGLS